MIEAARRLLAGARRAASLSGAGLSAESGVATFRDAAAGRQDADLSMNSLWSRYDPARLASPEGFAADPSLVIDWYAWRRRAIACAAPNAAHRALARCAGWTHVTQNVDDLLERAGAAGVVQVHGSIGWDRCHGGCGWRERIDLADPPALRACPRCGARARPDVVWFGETLPPQAWAAAERACAGCDVLLVVGTSAVVWPAAGLIGLAKSAGAGIVIVNTQPSEASHLADVELLGKAGEILPELLG